MYSLKINNSFQWNSLTWDQIYTKYFLIQKQIHNAALKCEYNKVYKLQNYVANSYEIKLLAIEHICKSFVQYKYYISSEEKKLIFQSFYNNNKITCKNILFIKEKVQQHILYLIHQSDWKVKFEPTIESKINNFQVHNLYNRLTDFFDIKLNKKSVYCLTYTMYEKYINISYLANKILKINPISHKIKKWFDFQYYWEEKINNIFVLEISRQFTNYSNNLYNIYEKILFNGLEWHFLISMQMSNTSYNYYIFQNNNIFKERNNWLILSSTKNSNQYINNLTTILDLCFYNTNPFRISLLNNCQYNLHNDILSTFQPRQEIQKIILSEIRQILYHKNIYNKWKPNINLSLNNCLNRINTKFIKWSKYYSNILNEYTIQECYEIIDTILYRWVKKYCNISEIFKLKNNKIKITDFIKKIY
uniref:Reverse transcriptase N-terminal domain-containing protein n=1 Tax=Asparagopsis taxiformis TaxID=260499 RepID=A0A1C9CC39_9FLOR|nr:hypothetical protein Aspa_056 [Asparagopsis taxiformis]AOM65935.1 hypothetical protein Aspa_056 [Asparagopsis taxiformis]